MDIYKSIFYLTIYFITFVLVLGFMVLSVNKQYIIDNWNVYRCNPLVMPFAGYFGFNSAENMVGCLNVSFNSYFGLFIRPFQYMIDIIKKIINDIIKQLDSIRNIIKPIRDFFETASAMVFKKIEAVMGTVIYSFLKINDLMKRMFANFRLAVYSLEATQMTVRSVWDGPIGKTTRFWAPTVDFFSDFFCFAPNTIINGIPIEQIPFDENIYGKLEVFSPKTMYRYNNVIVSGNHIVYDGTSWVRVKDVGTPEVSTFTKIYSLYTKNHRLTINNTLFCDYEETDKITKIQKSLILDVLRSPSTNILNDNPNLLMGTKLVKLFDGSFKPISELQLGEQLYENDIVLGKITQKLPLFVHSGYGINNIIQHNNEWQLLSDFVSNDAIEIESVYYNIVTINGFYYTNEFTVRDYLEVHDIELFNKIGDITILLLNSSLNINLA